MHELDLNDRIKDIPQIILLLEQGFSELKEIVSFYKFKSEMDEIFFFKIIKPKFFSKLIYYRKVYNIEMMRPNGQDCVLKNYFINELNQLENFYNKNIDFYKYYRSGSTHLDKYFFLRGKQDIQMTMETFYFERDPNFSTICDFKVAKIVANEMLRIYLNEEIAKIDEQQTTQSSGFPKTKITWTRTKTDLVELIYAVCEADCFNFGKANLKQIVSYFENIFNVDLGNPYHTYIEISRHTFVPNSFWAMVCRRTIPLLRKILMNEGIKNGSLYQNLELNSYFCIRRVL